MYFRVMKFKSFPLWLTAFALLPSLTLFAFTTKYAGARSMGLAHANVTLFDLYSATNNVAGLAHINGFGVGVGYETRFGLKEFGFSTLNLAAPFKWGTIGVSIQQFGFSAYNENQFGLAYALKLNRSISLGAQINYLYTAVAEPQTPNKSAITSNIGLQANATDKLSFGVHITNLSNASFQNSDKEKIPMIFRLGLNYQFSKHLFTVIDLEKNIDLPPNLKMGLEYHPIPILYFRTGIQSTDFSMSFGVGIQTKNLQFDFGLNHQTYVGYISQISLKYQIQKSE